MWLWIIHRTLLIWKPSCEHYDNAINAFFLRFYRAVELRIISALLRWKYLQVHCLSIRSIEAFTTSSTTPAVSAVACWTAPYWTGPVNKISKVNLNVLDSDQVFADNETTSTGLLSSYFQTIVPQLISSTF